MLDYVYDKLGRIESAVNKQTGSREKFAFDPAHNILSDKVSDGLKDKGLSEHLSDRHHTGRLKGRNIGKGNRLEAYNGIEYTYDALGNMIYRQLPNGESQFFQYDTENQLVLVEIKKPKGNTEIWEYAYDPFGRRLSKERKDKLAWTSTAPKRTHFVWDGARLLQEYTYKGSYTYVYTDQDSYEPLAQVFDNHKDRQQYLFYFHNNQIGTPHEMTDIHGNLLWYGSYSAWGSLSSENKIYPNIHQPFRLQNQYFDAETGLHYNFFRYYEPDTGRFVNQDPIRLAGGDNLYQFAPNVYSWVDPLGWIPRMPTWLPTKQGYQRQHLIPYSLRNHPIFANSGRSIHGATNMMYLPVNVGIDPNPKLGLHRGWTIEHKLYNEMVGRRLDNLQRLAKRNKWSNKKIAEEVLKLQSELRRGFKTGKYTCASPIQKK
ncbi:RHS repeat-associated core domain-containing protein [Neisseria canis]|uniref:RHS repeat-associated core domain-containing protein n=1 Tax=Neisseria canis TaxID=493 RepID=UPI00355918D6